MDHPRRELTYQQNQDSVTCTRQFEIALVKFSQSDNAALRELPHVTNNGNQPRSQPW